MNVSFYECHFKERSLLILKISLLIKRINKSIVTALQSWSWRRASGRLRVKLLLFKLVNFCSLDDKIIYKI